jgi:hypothetical protein
MKYFKAPEEIKMENVVKVTEKARKGSQMINVTLKNCVSAEDRQNAVKFANIFIENIDCGVESKEILYKCGNDAFIVTLTKAGNVISKKTRVLWLPEADA